MGLGASDSPSPIREVTVGNISMAQDVSLEFLARQLDRILTRLGAIEDQITVLTGLAIRHDGALTGLATEFRGLARAVNRADRRLRKLEDSDA
jgi:hypothetical protein